MVNNLPKVILTCELLLKSVKNMTEKRVGRKTLRKSGTRIITEMHCACRNQQDNSNQV